MNSGAAAKQGNLFETSDSFDMKKYVWIFLLCLCFITGMVTAHAEKTANDKTNTKIESNTEVPEKSETQDLIDNIADKLDTVLDENDNSLSESVDKALDKYSQNAIVRFFQKLFDAIGNLIAKIFEKASKELIVTE